MTCQRSWLATLLASLALGATLAGCGGQSVGTIQPSLQPGTDPSKVPPSTTHSQPSPFPPTAPAVASQTGMQDCSGQEPMQYEGRLAIVDDAGVVIVPSAGGSPIRLTENQLVWPPAWSPDGSTLAFPSSGGLDTSNLDIYVIHTDGTGLERVTTGPEADLAPVWSPDGDALAFESGFFTEYGYVTEVRYIDVATRIVHRLPSEGGWDSRYPAWSPDGTQVAFLDLEFPSVQSASYYYLYLFTLDSDSTTPLTSAAILDGASPPKWSPTGDTIVVALGETDAWRSDLALVDVHTGLIRNLTEDCLGNGHPDWSRDGSRIAFSSVRNGKGDIYVLDVATGLRRRLTDDPLLHADFPQWSPDGRTIAYVVQPFDVSRVGAQRYGGQSLALVSDDGCSTWTLSNDVIGEVRIGASDVWQSEEGQ